ncbi:antibiotic biosynthesis monooxygenase family protein [Shimazuella kribbensis]|uniref:antibiotic biosynthesis monooxygenase family protein n=1 Tax=Shimazuella kribbensis TaxID=139808 RepID=UPI00041F9FD6|nr:antibiotic biosynthesis monooxygenase family protein [Shimazuella kribbensis]
MIVEIIRYQIAEEQEETFLEAYRQGGKYLAESPNCLGFEVIKGIDKPQNFIVRIHWDSMDGHMKGFRSSDHFRSFFALVRPFFQSIQEMDHYELTDIKVDKGENQ